MQNLTHGSPTRLISVFATPILLGAVFQQVYLFIDAAVVGNFLGTYSLAAIGAPASVVFLLMGLSWGGNAGLAIPVARAFGAGDLAAVRRFFAAGIYVTVGLAAIITTFGAGFARQLLSLTNVPPEILDESTLVLGVLLGGAAISVTMNLLISTIRALGDSRTPLYFLVGSSILNAALVAVFIGGFNMGVVGAPLATLFSHLAAATGMILVVRRRIPALHLTREDLAAGWRSLAEPLRTGIPMALQMSTIAVGAVALQISVNGMGATSVAAWTAVERLMNLAVVPLMSFGIAVVTYVAQNRGAAEWRRVRIGVSRTLLLGTAFAVVIGLTLTLVSPLLAGLFVGGGEVEVLDMVRTFFLINGPLYWIVAAVFVLRNAVQGMGLSTVPVVSGAFETVGRVLSAVFLVGALGFVGVALAFPIAHTLGLLPVAWSWLRQRSRLLRLERADDAPTSSTHPEAATTLPSDSALAAAELELSPA
ncbi:MAG: MATE family efflux transporter [Promicromonosporaceae bacterium]|nr:MATE family efflux transporter [Promicromonosporaceae bacterium]